MATVKLKLWHTDDAERDIADAQCLADRVFVGIKLVDDRLADDADLGDGLHILVGKHRAGRDR